VKVIATAILVVLASGCTTSAIQDPSPNAREVTYLCTNGESLSVRFPRDQHLAILTRNDQSIELSQQLSGSGFIYSSGSTTIRGKGDSLTVEIGRTPPIQCTNQSPA